MALYHKYRPTSFSDMKGPDTLIKELESISSSGNHSFIFAGPSGSGKTTAVRILAGVLGCDTMDIAEFNSSNYTGVDDVRNIINDTYIRPYGKARLYVLDECHMLTKNAQEALLKPLEDYPEWIYFVLCTTDPSALLTTIKSRCTMVKFQGLTDDDLFSILKGVKRQEGYELTRDELYAIVGAADGNARKALVLLESVAGLSAGDRANYIQSGLADNKYTIDLCRALFSNNCEWDNISPILISLKEQKEDAEKVRRAILGYGQAILLKCYSEKTLAIMGCFEQPMYDTGFAGITLACGKAFEEIIRRVI